MTTPDLTHAEVKCACPSFDAMACYRLHHNIDDEDYADPEDACECYCHDKGRDDDDE